MKITLGTIREEIMKEADGETASLKITVIPDEEHENSGWEYDQYKLTCNVQYSLNGEEPTDATHTFFGVNTDYNILMRDLPDSLLGDIGAGIDTAEFENMARSDSENFSIDGLEDVIATMESAQQEEQNSSSW